MGVININEGTEKGYFKEIECMEKGRNVSSSPFLPFRLPIKIYQR